MDVILLFDYFNWLQKERGSTFDVYVPVYVNMCYVCPQIAP